jgi:Fe-S-cluster containining protein
MNSWLHILKKRPLLLESFSKRMGDLFSRMDQAYQTAAEYYGFVCNGCSDNCCFTRFHHHTFIEYLMIYAGYQKLDPLLQEEIRRKAEIFTAKAISPLMCPLNIDGRCILYPYRPMICRLHGIPHELHTPGRPPYHGAGCDFFSRSCGHRKIARFDRTPFYFEMAKIEKEFKIILELHGKMKMTVADMISEFTERH